MVVPLRADLTVEKGAGVRALDARVGGWGNEREESAVGQSVDAYPVRVYLGQLTSQSIVRMWQNTSRAVMLPPNCFM